MQFFAPISKEQARQLSPLSLSFIGDAVETLYVREELTKNSQAKAHRLHIQAAERINAAAQAREVDRVLPLLNEEEADVFRRARNAKNHTVPKHAAIGDYKKASALEAVWGYLYLTGQQERLLMLLAVGGEA